MATLASTGLETLLGGLGLKTPVPKYDSADVLNNPLDIGRCYVADIVHSMGKCNEATAYDSIQYPNNVYMGDLSVILPKIGNKADYEMVILEAFAKFPECPLLMPPFVDGVHLRIMFDPEQLTRLILPYIHDRKTLYGKDTSIGLHDASAPELGRKKVIVEFSSPNIASDFQAKHLRSTILGGYVASLYEAMGWDVVKLNYLGDWGKPLGLLGVGWEDFGSEELFNQDPIGHLAEVYNKINELFVPEQEASRKARDKGEDTAEIESKGLFARRNDYFKRMQDGDDKALAFWKRVRDANIENYTKLYARLNVSFDDYSGESQVKPETMTEIEELLKAKGLCDESGGSLIIDLKKHGSKSGTAIIRDRNGSTTYLLRDLAAVLERSRKYSFDKMIYVVAADSHTTHFSRLFKILQLMDMGELAQKLQHHHFSDKSKMGEALGHGHGLDVILDKCQNAMLEALKAHPEKADLLGDVEKNSTTIGINALLSQELSTRREKEHVFDIERMTSFEGRSGPALESWYARLGSLTNGMATDEQLSDDDISSFKGDEYKANLLRQLAQFPSITHSTYQTLEPAILTEYLFGVMETLQDIFGEAQESPTVSRADAGLYGATRVVLSSGMKLLRITPISE